jgi:hypothetical protein
MVEVLKGANPQVDLGGRSTFILVILLSSDLSAVLGCNFFNISAILNIKWCKL